MISQVRNRARGVARRMRPVPPAEAAGPPAVAPANEHRHPAMRGLDVSPVHGRHCNCNRCDTSRAA
jgi:hypothetical protein